MKNLLILAAVAVFAAVSCTSRTHGADPEQYSIEGAWLVDDIDVTAMGDNTAEAEAILLDLFAGFDGFTLRFNPDGTVVTPEGTSACSMTDFDLWIDPIGGASVEFTVNTLNGTDLAMTCNALTGIGEPVAFPPGVTALQLYLHAKKR